MKCGERDLLAEIVGATIALYLVIYTVVAVLA